MYGKKISTIFLIALFFLSANTHGQAATIKKGSTAPASVAAEFYPVATSTQSVITPYPYNGLYAGFTAPTLNIPNATASYQGAMNQLDGFSTVSDIYFDIPTTINYSNLGSQIVIMNSTTSQKLVYGTDFTIQQDNATATNPSTGTQQSISSYSARVIISLLKPLASNTTYWIGIYNGIKTSAGGAVIAGPEFIATSSATPVSQQTSSFVKSLSSSQISSLESVRSSLIYPTVSGLSEAGIESSNLVLAWPFTTQTIGQSLTSTNSMAVAGTIKVANTNLTTSAVVNMPGANIYAGTLSIPYYQQNSGGNPESTIPLSTYWEADSSKPSSGSFQGISCASFAKGAVENGVTLKPSASTTGCFPYPIKRSEELVPILVAVPNGDSNRTKPANGWPIIIFQHPLGGSREDMLILAPAFAAQGFAVIAMDMPLHGVTDTTDSLYQNQLFANTANSSLVTGERTFNLDLENNSTGAQGSDGEIDPSGTWFLNFNSPLTFRDNLRQAESDLMTLTKSLSSINLTHDGTPQIDTTQIRFASMSLGSVTGITFLAYAPQIGAASVNVPGGGIGKLLDASYEVGPYLTSAASSLGLTEGTEAYETYLRYFQSALDDGDPINYAATTRSMHPMHMEEVINDLVIPNAAPVTAGSSTENMVTIAGYLSGGNPMYSALGLKVVGPISVPVVNPSLITGKNLGEVVQFSQGAHASLLDPAPNGVVSSTNAAVTAEMQREMANFLSSNGSCLPIGQNCPSQ